MECVKGQSGVRKEKKKQVKDDMDRQKQAEKKKRRLEKALANSAAIISKLEKKKQRRKEEQQRLDEEGAAIAEAVALHVLLGEDSDESCKIMLKNDVEFNPWDCVSNIDLSVPHSDLRIHSLGALGWVSNVHGSRCKMNEWGSNDMSVSSGHFERNLSTPYLYEGGCDGTEISADLIAAQAVSSLQIAEDSDVDSLVFNRMLSSSSSVGVASCST